MEISLMVIESFLGCSESAVCIVMLDMSMIACLISTYLSIGFIVQMVNTSKKVLNHADLFPSERVKSGHICLSCNSTVTGRVAQLRWWGLESASHIGGRQWSVS